MVADYEYEDLATVENDYGAYTELLAHRKVVSNPLAGLTIEELLHMPAHEIHKVGVEACNKGKPSINTGQTSATTQVGRIVNPHNRKNLVKVDVKPAVKRVDVSEYMMANLSDYGLDVDCPIIASFDEEEAPHSDFDVGEFTHTHANISPLRQHNSGPITNALATAAEFIADMKEAKAEHEEVAEAVEKLWGCKVSLQESGLIPEPGDRSIRRFIAEQYKNSYYVYGNEGQLSMFVASTAQNWDILLPPNQALDFHRMRYIAKAACYLDYISTATPETKAYYHSAQHYFGYRPGQILHLSDPIISLKVPNTIEENNVMWLPPMLIKNLSVTEQVKKMELVMNRDYFHVKDLIQDHGEEAVRELLNATLNALKRSMVAQPGFGKRSDVAVNVADITYEIRAPSLTASNIASTSILQLLVNALTAKYVPGVDGTLDGWFKECVKIVRQLYMDEANDKELLIVAHKLDGLAVQDVIAHMSNESTKAEGKKSTKAMILTRMQGWFSRINILDTRLSTLSKPWLIAHLVYNKADAYLNKLNYLMGRLVEATSGFKVTIDSKRDLIQQINDLILVSNKHIRYFADTYAARGQAMRDLGRIHSAAYKAGMEFEYIHAARFMRCVKFIFSLNEVTFEIDMVEARSNILHTLKTANIIVTQNVLSMEPTDMFEELKRTTVGSNTAVIDHLYMGYKRAVKYLKWRHHDLLRQLDPYLMEVQKSLENIQRKNKKKNEIRTKKMRNAVQNVKRSRPVTFRGVKNEKVDPKSTIPIMPMTKGKYIPPYRRDQPIYDTLPIDPKHGKERAAKDKVKKSLNPILDIQPPDIDNIKIELKVDPKPGASITYEPDEENVPKEVVKPGKMEMTEEEKATEENTEQEEDLGVEFAVSSDMGGFDYSVFMQNTMDMNVHDFNTEQEAIPYMRKERMENTGMEISRDVSVTTGVDMSRYAFALANEESKHATITEEDQLTDLEARWAEMNAVPFSTVLVFNANALNLEEPILDELLKKNPYLPPSVVTRTKVSIDNNDLVNKDIIM